MIALWGKWAAFLFVCIHKEGEVSADRAAQTVKTWGFEVKFIQCCYQNHALMINSLNKQVQ